MSLFDPIFNYCERLETGLFAEPLNAFSNIAFFIAALFLYRLYNQPPQQVRGDRLLIVLVFTVGVGSTLFHTFANALTMLADIIPIVTFVFCYLFIAMRRLLGFSRVKAGLWLLVFLVGAASTGFAPPEWRFNGSVDYFPCLVALALIAWRSHSKMLAIGVVIFALSLTFRSVDMMLCPSIAFGTHFLWHLLNGVLLYTLVKALLINSQLTIAR